MKFVSVFLVAMIAMMLVVPALSECTKEGEACTSQTVCCGWNTATKHACQFKPPPSWDMSCENGQNLPTMGFRGINLVRSQVRKSLLSALNILEDN